MRDIKKGVELFQTREDNEEGCSRVKGWSVIGMKTLGRIVDEREDKTGCLMDLLMFDPRA